MWSKIPSHCIAHALSDPTSTEFRTQCSSKELENSHDHEMSCTRCELLAKTEKSVMDELTKIIENSIPEEINDLKNLYDNLITAQLDVHNLMQHQLRAVHSELVRQQIVDGLKVGEALVTIDFSQKFLAMKHREQQSDYYAKRGMSCHVAHVLANISGYDTLVQHTYVHLLGNEAQVKFKIFEIFLIKNHFRLHQL